jgi:hypothetical chaperone protein
VTSQPSPVLGIDFGTTNTVIAISEGPETARVLRFPAPGGAQVAAFRSVLSFRERDRAERAGEVEAGPWAIDAFLEDPLATRLIQSFKTFAASAAFSGTVIFGRRFQFEDLLLAYMRQIRQHSGLGPGELTGRAIVGRPVGFAGAQPDEALALRRYSGAFDQLGLKDRALAYEPVGAAFFFAKRLAASATVLVADFGGGTSDFSVMRFERRNGRMVAIPLSRSGVGVAGDAFDYRIIDQVVSPVLGKGGGYRSGGKVLPIPNRYYAAFARWNQLAILKGSREFREIREVARTAEDRDALARFVALIANDEGYALYQAVSAAKEALSSADRATLRFRSEEVEIEAEIARADFEQWIAPELTAIDGAVDCALAQAGLTAGDIDRVFLTGGSSFVPAVRARLTDRFGAPAIETGGEFESIATGLAMIGAEPDPGPWIAGPE